jgi:hypothetical protein
LLEYCLDGGYLKDFDVETQEPLSALLELCSQFSSASPPTSWAYLSEGDDLDDASPDCFEQKLERVCQTGCDINVQSSQGLSAWHFLINGKSTFDVPSLSRIRERLLKKIYISWPKCESNFGQNLF